MNSIANVVIGSLMNSLWQGILLLALVICILRILRRLNATTRYIVLFLTLLTLAFLPFLNLLLISGPAHSQQKTAINDVHQADTLKSGADEHLTISPVQRSDPLSSNIGKATERDPEESFIARLQRLKSINIPVPFKALPSLVFGLWVLVTILMLLRLLSSYFYTRKLKRGILVLSPKYQQEITELIRTIGIRRRVVVYVTSNVRMPMVIGLVNPVILIPDDLVGELTEEQLRHVILHESAHIRRWDDWTNLIQKIIEAFYFWNPMVLYIGRQMNLEREIACDDWVIVLFGEPKSYALCLTKLIEFGMSTSDRILSTGAIMHRKHISARIRMLLDKGLNTNAHFSRSGVLATICVIMLAFAVFIRFSNILALAEPQSDDSQLSQQDAQIYALKSETVQYPELHVSEDLYQGAKDDSKEAQIPGRTGSRLSKTLKDKEVSVSGPFALQNTRANLSENIYQRTRSNQVKQRISDELAGMSKDSSVRTSLGVIGGSDKISQPGITALAKTVEAESEKVHFQAADMRYETHKGDISTIDRVRIEMAKSSEGLKSSSLKMLENLGDKQERLHSKAADTLVRIEKPMVEAKGNAQAFIGNLFSEIEEFREGL